MILISALSASVHPASAWALGWQALGVVVTASAFLLAGLVYLREHGDRVRKQASVVAVWAINWSPLIYKGGTSEIEVDVLIRNGSEIPVYDFIAEIHVPGVAAQSVFVKKGVLPPGDTPIKRRLPSAVVLNPADASGKKAWVLALGDFEIEVMFRDTANRCWRRPKTGRLERMRSNRLDGRMKEVPE